MQKWDCKKNVLLSYFCEKFTHPNKTSKHFCDIHTKAPCQVKVNNKTREIFVAIYKKNYKSSVVFHQTKLEVMNFLKIY